MLASAGSAGDQYIKSRTDVIDNATPPPLLAMKPRDYCCCAIPLVNAGIYLTILVQFVVAFVAGILALATPSCKCDPEC